MNDYSELIYELTNCDKANFPLVLQSILDSVDVNELCEYTKVEDYIFDDILQNETISYSQFVNLKRKTLGYLRANTY